MRGFVFGCVLLLASSAHGMSPSECRAVANQSLVEALKHSRGLSTDVAQLLREFGAEVLEETIEVIDDVAVLEAAAWKAHDLTLNFCRLIEKGAAAEELRRAADASILAQKAVTDLLKEGS